MMRKLLNILLVILLSLTCISCSAIDRVNSFVNKYFSDFNFVIEKIDEHNFLLKNDEIEANLNYSNHHFSSDLSDKYFSYYNISNIEITIEELDQYISIINNMINYDKLEKLYNLYLLNNNDLKDVVKDSILITIQTKNLLDTNEINSSLFSFIKNNEADSILNSYINVLKENKDALNDYLNKHNISSLIQIYEVDDLKEIINDSDSIILKTLENEITIAVYVFNDLFKTYSLSDFINSDVKDEYINDVMNKMSLKEKISQMFLIQNGGNTFTSSYENYLNNLKPGGVVLFKNNLSSDVNSTINYINSIKETGSLPLFIGIDEEGGSVQRLNKINGTTYIPTMYQVGKSNDEELAYDMGKLIGEELRVFGFNLDFAPCADVYYPNNTIIKTRAFSSDANVVAKMATFLSDGLNDVGIISCYKHFPGHGDTAVDSHKDLPVINKTKEELYNEELIPFIEAIKNDAQIIMVGHLSIPEISGDKPASLSYEMITGLLREELGYDGLIVTDSLGMAGVTKYYSTKDIVTLAINAGVNLLLNPADPLNTVNLIADEVNAGNISLDNINYSVYKIIELKIDFVYENYYSNLDVSYLNNEEHKAIINKVNSY